MQKITFVISDDKYLMSHRITLIRFLIERGYSVSAIVKITDPALKAQIKAYGCEVIDLKYRSSRIDLFGNIKLFFKLISIFNRTKPDMIHAISMRMIFISLMAYRFSLAKKYVATITGLGNLATSSSWITQCIKYVVFRLMRRMLFSHDTKLIVQNEDDYLFAKNHFIDESRLYLIRGSGVDIHSFTPQREPDIDCFIVSIVSRMLKDKGIVEAIEAIKSLSRKYPRIQLQLVGDVYLANPLSLTEKEMIVLSDHSNITWLGFQSDIVNVWRNTHVALLPSYREGLPKSLLEAAACAKPIVTTDVPGCREIVKDNVNGFLVTPRSANAIANAIEKLINLPALRSSFGNVGRKMVEDYFSDEIINQEVLSCYENK